MDKPKIKEPFVTSGMKIPKNVIYTGDIEAVSAYLNGEPLDAEGAPLGEAAKRHLLDRVENMKYINERAKEFAYKKTDPLPAKQTENGFVLQGIRQPERQQTGHCCWTMPAKLMLQNRGIDLDQECIRCYKPEIVLDEEKLNELDDGTVREFTRNVNGNIKNLSGLMHKFLPNSVMVQTAYSVPYLVKTDPDAKAENEILRADFKRQITESIRDHRCPVALLRNGHYRTVVGIDGDDLLIKDSLSAVHGPDDTYRVSVDSMFRTPLDRTEITYMRDLTVTDPGALPVELSHLAPVLEVGTGENKGVLSAKDIKGDVKLPSGGSVSLFGEAQHGNKVSLLYEPVLGTRSDGSPITAAQQWILPEKIDEKVISLTRPEEAEIPEEADLTDEEVAEKGGEDYGFDSAEELKTNRDLSLLAAREDEYMRELPESGYKRLIEMTNEARQELRRFASVNELTWTAEDMKNCGRCMHVLVLSKLIEAERAMGNEVPGSLEKRFDNGNGLEEMLDDPVLNRYYFKCPAPSDMDRRSVAAFILNDGAGKIVRQSMNEACEQNPKLSAAQKTAMKKKIADSTDPLHENSRLAAVYKTLKNCDPALMRSSEEFRAMKRSLEQVIELRKNRCDIADGKTVSETAARDTAALKAAYGELSAAARAYMNTKSPVLLKEGTTAQKRYAAAGLIFDLANEFRSDYAELNRKAEADRQSAASEKSVSAFSAESGYSLGEL